MTLIERLNKLFIPSNEGLVERRYDLDWLRVLAFGLLILFHVGMMYTANWGWHIKSSYSSLALESVMLLVEPWRMAILWFVSGVAIRFVLVKVSLKRFVMLRSYRLLLPLLFGILVVVPPQLYYEMTFKGDLAISYWSFYQQFFDLESPLFKDYQSGIWPHIDVNHLWYLRELWQFSLYLLFLLPILNSTQVTGLLDRLVTLNGWLLLVIFSLPILVIQLVLGTDGEREALGFTFLVYGYVIGWHDGIWQRIKMARRQMLVAALVCYVLLVVCYNLIYLEEAVNQSLIWHYLMILVYGLDRVFWLLVILGFGSVYLNRRSDKLSYFNQAVYPYYIIHQSVIVVLGYELSQLKLGGFIEPFVLVVLTFLFCALAFELIRRVTILRPLFGVKVEGDIPRWQLRVGYGVAAILVVPFGIEILI